MAYAETEHTIGITLIKPPVPREPVGPGTETRGITMANWGTFKLTYLAGTIASLSITLAIALPHAGEISCGNLQ